MKPLTPAQVELLKNLDEGWEVTFTGGHYSTVKDDLAGAKLWPSTFYGLFDNRLIERLKNGNYTISYYGQQQIQRKDAGMVEASPKNEATILEKAPST